MVASIHTVAFVGVCTVDVVVQVHITSGLPAFHIVGMADKVVAESRERIRAALASIRIVLPPKRITVSLSPAGIFKEGSHYDLPIALGVLTVLKIIKNEASLKSFIVLGELLLDGSITCVSGILAAAHSAKKQGKGIICPHDNAREALLIGDIRVLGSKHLLQLVNHANGSEIQDTEIIEKTAECAEAKCINGAYEALDMQDVAGQEIAKRAALITAAGGHNLLMVGPPGAGKSMIAKRICSILPDLSADEIIDVNIIYSIARRKLDCLATYRPFREPHSSASMAAIIGGGLRSFPGEITLAHHGILFLDELPEFSKSVLEALRQPLEDKQVVIARANAHITYPANFQLVAAMNPCRCGYLNDASRKCSRAPQCAVDYQKRISGPIMSRIDIKVEVGNVSVFAQRMSATPESSKSLKGKVIAARLLQTARVGTARKSNAFLTPNEVEKFVIAYMCDAAKKLLIRVLEHHQLSNRDTAKILKVARTIADLSESSNVLEEHIAEAITLFGCPIDHRI
ncbi:competence protein ComM [Anaplasma platys]|uniref:Competence protein ComM n=1 Tax=Anaplasma platys TaxID=949 RepID=A0A858PYD7_9RICK|nr:YifB family Mg chelatase-like AAA ATPase [Anaplasma platys]QJC27626.1 competence protein ComM [Anaplasma platys]